MGSPLKFFSARREETGPSNEAEVAEHLEAYMSAFLGTEEEFIAEFEEAGIACWLDAERADKR